MTETAQTFSSRSNAKRAAEKMISAGTAPAVDYGIKPTDDERFEIVWKTGNGSSAAATTDEEQAALAATEAGPAGAAPQAAPEAEAAPGPAPAAHAPIGAGSEPAAQGDQDPELAGFETPRLIAELVRRGHRVALASSPRRSKTAELDEAAARGVMPTKPDVTTHANHHYQKRFDKLAELAAAGDWAAVAGYECTGVNTYAKMVRQYRDRLVTAHKAQESATAQGAA